MRPLVGIALVVALVAVALAAVGAEILYWPVILFGSLALALVVLIIVAVSAIRLR